MWTAMYMYYIHNRRLSTADLHSTQTHTIQAASVAGVYRWMGRCSHAVGSQTWL